MYKHKLRYVVFTDASFKKRNGSSYCGYGAVVVNLETNQYVSFSGELSDRSIVFGESWAILKGLQKTLKLIQQSDDISGDVMVVTDSKLCVNILTDYIPKWDTSDWNDWKTRKGQSVKNQDIYKRIVRLLENYPDVHFRITHIHGHQGKSNEGKIRKDLMKHGITPTDAAVSTFRRMNAMADRLAQAEVDRQIKLETLYGTVSKLRRNKV